MSVRMALVYLVCAGVVRAEETPAYKRFKGIAAEMAKFGMPVDVGRVWLTVKEPTSEEFLSGLKVANAARTDTETGRDRGARVVMGEYSPSERRIWIMARGSEMWSGGDALVAHELAHAFQHQRHPRLSAYRDGQTSERWMIQACMLEDEDTFGELHLQLEFSSKLKPQDAIRAAIGWDGDRLRKYRSESGEKFTVWTSVWDREIDAMQAETAIRKVWRGGTTLRRGRTVSWVQSSDKVLRERLATAFRNWDCSGELGVADAISTTSAEGEAMRLCAQTHRLRDGRWFLPEVRVSIPVPEGWKLRLNRDGVRLRKILRRGSSDIVVDSWPMAAFGDIEGLSEHLGRPLHALNWMRTASIDRIERDGAEALLVRRYPMRGRRRTRYEFIELYVPRAGTVVRYTTMLLRSRIQAKEREEVMRAFADFRVERE